MRSMVEGPGAKRRVRYPRCAAAPPPRVVARGPPPLAGEGRISYSAPMNTLLVMLGGAIGAAARYQIGGIASRAFGPSFPWGTLTVNILGGLLMGLLIAREPGEAWRLLLGVGVLGGFTTFSAFSLETVSLIERGEIAPASVYILASVFGACIALWAGLALGKAVA